MAIPGNKLSSATESMDPSISGWSVDLNCTLSQGTGGRNGDKTLRLTSVASGEMRARTASLYSVTPGQEYQAFADASGATVPERIGIRWFSAGPVVEMSVTWSLTTATASSTWHRISVSGVAPAGAGFAQVVFSSTPAAGSVISAFENVYLGVPFRTTGNLLSADAENTENSTLKWATESNCSLARQAPMVQWPVDDYYSGGHVLAMTVTANGNAAIKCSEKPSATAGKEYIGYAYLNPPTSGSTTWVELRFYNAADSQLSATRANLAAPGTGYYQQRVSAVAPANTSYAVLAAGITSGTAAQVVRVDRAVIAAAPVIREGSVLPYADASFEKDQGAWTVVSGVATLARSTPWGTYATEGAYALTVSSATATTSVIRSAKYAMGAAGGQSHQLQFSANVTAGGWNINRSVRWYDASNNDLGLTSSGSAAAPTPDWWSLSNFVTAPANATQAAVELSLAATSTSSTLRIDQVALLLAYPSIDAVGDDDSASITLTLRELTVGYTLYVWRVLVDGTRTLVRGPTGLIDGDTITADVAVIEDYEAPLGVPVSYYVEIYEPGDPVPETRTSVTVTLDPGDPNWVWLKDPARPQRNRRVLVSRAPTWSRPIQQAEYRVRSRRNSVVLSDVRGGLEGDLAVFTETDDERDSLHLLLDPGSVLLWQAAPGYGIADMYVTVAAVSEERGGGTADNAWRTWTLPLRQADMPTAVGVAGSAGRTWQDVLAESPTWADVVARYATWEDLFLNRPIGG